MFWSFLLLVGIASAFIRLGAMSVWVNVLIVSLIALLFLVVVMGLWCLWRHYRTS